MTQTAETTAETKETVLDLDALIKEREAEIQRLLGEMRLLQAMKASNTKVTQPLQGARPPALVTPSSNGHSEPAA
jgi:hypothetical protein